jgi:maltose phosphorylase
MAKIADKYYITDPWNITEEDFNPSYSQVSESIFSLGNEYMGVRGYFEEGYSGDSLLGSYFNGIYESVKVEGSAYKGIIDRTEFMVNSIDWLCLQIRIDDETVDLNRSKIKDFIRTLNLKTGVLTRSYIWILEDGREIKLEFERFLSMKDAHQAGQRITLTPLNFAGEVNVTVSLDVTQPHRMVNKNLWSVVEKKGWENYLSIKADTLNTNQTIYSICRIDTSEGAEEVVDEKLFEEKKISKQYIFQLEQGKSAIVTRVVMNVTRKSNSKQAHESFHTTASNAFELITLLNYDTMKAENIAWWDRMWKDSDIVIDGDELNQQGIRYCIFQMHQTYHGADSGSIIGAKGLTGEAYSGNTFWDTETYCLPFYIFNNIDAARHLLDFRYLTLPEAKERAKALDCEGAFYPIATISGRECCSLWQHASLQMQPSTAVAYGFRHYEKVTKDEAFVFHTGLPILIEICRMLGSRGDWNADHTRYGYYGVMGPDEFQMMVNNNCYTNYMGKVTFEYALDVLERFQKKDPVGFETLRTKSELKEEECDNWRTLANKMYIPYEEETKLFEQHEGYFDLPHIDVDAIPIEEFPLYHHWSYDRIYRNDMIKQPDVLMMMLLYNGNFTKEQLMANYEYYEPRCIHESSLSPSVHSILAVQLQKHEEAYKFFGFATRMDLDNYNRNTSEGLHTTSIAAAWMNIVYGFGGMRSDGEQLSFSPSIPKDWKGYSFRIHYQNDVIQVEITKEYASFSTLNGTEIAIQVYDQFLRISQKETKITIPKEWRG